MELDDGDRVIRWRFQIIDVNDNKPEVTSSPEIVVNDGDASFEVTAKDDDQNDNANVSFEILKVWKKESLGRNRRDGEGVDQCDSETGRFRFKDRLGVFVFLYFFN